MKKKLKNVLLGIFVSTSLAFTSLVGVSHAYRNSYTIEAVVNGDSDVLDVNITRIGDLRENDQEYYNEAISLLPNWVDDSIREVRIHFFSPLLEEEQDPQVEYSRETIFVNGARPDRLEYQFDINAMDNCFEQGVLDVNITREGSLRYNDQLFYDEAIDLLPNWMDSSIREVRIHFFSPLSDEEDNSEIEFTCEPIFFNFSDEE